MMMTIMTMHMHHSIAIMHDDICFIITFNDIFMIAIGYSPLLGSQWNLGPCPRPSEDADPGTMVFAGDDPMLSTVVQRNPPAKSVVKIPLSIGFQPR